MLDPERACSPALATGAIGLFSPDRVKQPEENSSGSHQAVERRADAPRRLRVPASLTERPRHARLAIADRERGDEEALWGRLRTLFLEGERGWSTRYSIGTMSLPFSRSGS